MIKTNIKMRVTPEQSRRVQEICFENGIEWQDSKKTLQEYEYIIIRKDYLITCSGIKHYNEYVEKEISADLFIKTNDKFKKLKESFEKLTVIELQKKIENLHIALNKKVEKNKNQALEINRLLEQKKAMKCDINIAINHLLEMKELKAKLKEKDTIISYLESKLK